MDAHLASPSKARAHALETHSWAVVTAFLADLYHPHAVPAFDKNPATLAALQQLLGVHQAAEARHQRIHAARVEEATMLRVAAAAAADENDGYDDVLAALEAKLDKDASDALDALARAAVLIGVSPTEDGEKEEEEGGASVPAQLATALPELNVRAFELEDQVARIDGLVATLEGQIASLQVWLASGARPGDLEHEDPETPESSPRRGRGAQDAGVLVAQTQQFVRETKQLALKSAEYQERIAALERNASQGTDSGPSMADVAAAQERAKALREDVSILEAKIVRFHGLPPDVKTSRAEVNRMQGELEKLRQRRDGLFENLGDGTAMDDQRK